MKKRTKNYNKISGIFLLFSICFSFFVNTTIIFADDDQVIDLTPKNETGNTQSDTYQLLAPIGELEFAPDNIGDYFNTIFTIAIGLAGALAVIMIVVGGVQYMGDESIFGKTEAKSKIMSAVLGLLIALGSYALLNTINPDLLGGKGVKIKQVEIDITEAEAIKQESTPVYGVPIGKCAEGIEPVTVNGVVIMNTCKSIAAKVILMIYAAQADGITLTGNSFRSASDQIQARKDNGCPDIYTSLPSACRVPTAIPGTSLHESGLAIDFMCNGAGQFINLKKRPETKVCWDWLVANASKHGLFNLPSENWHWSTTGQ